MYLVEMVGVNRLVSVIGRARYYENADDIYTAAKKGRFLELKLLRYQDGERVLLKFINRSSKTRRAIQKECDNADV